MEQGLRISSSSSRRGERFPAPDEDSVPADTDEAWWSSSLAEIFLKIFFYGDDSEFQQIQWTADLDDVLALADL